MIPNKQRKSSSLIPSFAVTLVSLALFVAGSAPVLGAEVKYNEYFNTEQSELVGTVYFDTGSHQIKDTYQPDIQAIAAKFAAAGEGARLYVMGHTDEVGNFTYNLKLSENRSNAVRAAILSEGSGLNAYNIFVYGFAYQKPVIPGAQSASAKAQNRRVEVFLEKPVDVMPTPEPEPEPEPVVIPDDVQNFQIVFDDSDNFNVVIKIYCDAIPTFYGDWKAKYCPPDGSGSTSSQPDSSGEISVKPGTSGTGNQPNATQPGSSGTSGQKLPGPGESVAPQGGGDNTPPETSLQVAPSSAAQPSANSTQ